MCDQIVRRGSIESNVTSIPKTSCRVITWYSVMIIFIIMMIIACLCTYVMSYIFLSAHLEQPTTLNSEMVMKIEEISQYMHNFEKNIFASLEEVVILSERVLDSAGFQENLISQENFKVNMLYKDQLLGYLNEKFSEQQVSQIKNMKMMQENFIVLLHNLERIINAKKC